MACMWFMGFLYGLGAVRLRSYHKDVLSVRNFRFPSWCRRLPSSGVVTQRMLVVYRRLETACRSHLQGSSSPRIMLRCYAVLVGVYRRFETACLSMNCLTREDGTDRMSRNVDKHLPTYAASQPRRAKTSHFLKLASADGLTARPPPPLFN
jgi:hypothetical protein